MEMIDPKMPVSWNRAMSAALRNAHFMGRRQAVYAFRGTSTRWTYVTAVAADRGR